MRRFWWKPCICVAELSPNIYTKSTKLSFGVIVINGSLCPGPTSRPQAGAHTHTHKHRTETVPVLTGSLSQSRCAQALVSVRRLEVPLPSAKMFPPTPCISVFPKQQTLQVLGICGRLRAFAGVVRIFAGVLWVIFGEQNLEITRDTPKSFQTSLLEPQLGNQE